MSHKSPSSFRLPKAKSFRCPMVALHKKDNVASSGEMHTRIINRLIKRK